MGRTRRLEKTSSGVSWIIECFSFTEFCYATPLFQFVGECWTLWINVNYSPKNIAAYLDRTTNGPSINLDCSLSLETPKGVKYAEIQSTQFFEREEAGRPIGFLQYSQKMSKMVPEEKLTVVCTLNCTESTINAVTYAETDNEDSFDIEYSTGDEYEFEYEFKDRFEYKESSEDEGSSENESLSSEDESDENDFKPVINRFLDEKRDIDVTFVLETPDGKEEYFAHQLVLAMKSSYFSDEFYTKRIIKKKLKFRLKNVDPKAFSDMLRYCYDHKPSFSTFEEIFALLEVADQFKVISLVEKCRTSLRYARIEPGSVFSLLFVSEKMKDKSLSDKCNKFLQRKTKEVIEYYELRDVTPFMVNNILSLPTLSLCSEYELMTWIFDWANAKCQEEESSSQSTRGYLGIFIQNMNFLALAFEEFSMLHTENKGFFSLQEFESVSLNIAIPGRVEMPGWFGKDLRLREYTGSKE